MGKRKYLWLLAILFGLWLIVGPRPADNSHYRGSEYYAKARQTLASQAPESASGPLAIGVAEVDISPKPGQPLAGFGGRRPKTGSSMESPCLARALSLRVGGLTTSILTADLLLMDDALVAEVLRQTGLERQDIYFTASHSHSCAGGFAQGFVQEQIFGSYDPDWFKTLAQRLAKVVLESRQGFVPVEFAHASINVANSQQNRIDHSAPTNDQLDLLLFRRPQDSGPPLAILGIFGAHATVFGLNSHLISADYPGHFLAELKASTEAAHLLFAAGSVGDARPDGPAIASKDPAINVRNYGRLLKDAALSGMENLAWQQSVQLARLSLPLELPQARLPVGPNWAWAPWVGGLLADRHATLNGLRINDLVVLGFPVDYSGHLATALAARFKNQADIVTTSFSGGYKGYLVASSWFFGHSRYETRTVNFFGPWAGDYLNDMAEAIARRLLGAE